MESQLPDHLVKVAQNVTSKLKMKLPKIVVTERVRALGAWTNIITGKVMLSRKVVDQLNEDELFVLLLHEFKHLKYRNLELIIKATAVMSCILLVIYGSLIHTMVQLYLLVFLLVCTPLAVLASSRIIEREVVAYTYDMCGKIATWNLFWKLLRILGKR